MKNRFKVLIIVMLLLLTTGCGANDYLKDGKKIVKYEKTGQNLPSNILCKPTDKELLKVYKKYDKQLKIKLDKLPECKNFKINSNKSTGIWEFLFVKPLAYLIIVLGKLFKNMGISLIIVGLLIRIILLPFSYKTHTQSKNMAKVQKDMEKLEYKYRGRDDQESMMMKSQEMMAIYRKHNVKPMGGCLVAFLQLPIFFAFLQAINRTPVIFEGRLLGFNLGMTPYVGLSHGNYLYILLILLIAVSTYFSFKYSMRNTAAMNNDMGKQMSSMTTTMTILIIITSFSLSTAISFYWITTYAFIAIQTYLFKKLSSDKEVKPKKNIKDKLEKKEKLKYGTNK